MYAFKPTKLYLSDAVSSQNKLGYTDQLFFCEIRKLKADSQHKRFPKSEFDLSSIISAKL